MNDTILQHDIAKIGDQSSERSGKRSGAGRKSGERERSGERTLLKVLERQRKVEQETAERIAG